MMVENSEAKKLRIIESVAAFLKVAPKSTQDYLLGWLEGSIATVGQDSEQNSA